MGEERKVVVVPETVLCALRALVAEYDPDTYSAGIVVSGVLEELGKLLDISFMEGHDDEAPPL
jgi:hypothetical protein